MTCPPTAPKERLSPAHCNVGRSQGRSSPERMTSLPLDGVNLHDSAEGSERRCRSHTSAATCTSYPFPLCPTVGHKGPGYEVQVSADESDRHLRSAPSALSCTFTPSSRIVVIRSGDDRPCDLPTWHCSRNRSLQQPVLVHLSPPPSRGHNGSTSRYTSQRAHRQPATPGRWPNAQGTSYRRCFSESPSG